MGVMNGGHSGLARGGLWDLAANLRAAACKRHGTVQLRSSILVASFSPVAAVC